MYPRSEPDVALGLLTPASALSRTSSGPDLTSLEVVSGLKQKLRSQFGQELGHISLV